MYLARVIDETMEPDQNNNVGNKGISIKLTVHNTQICTRMLLVIFGMGLSPSILKPGPAD